VTQALDVPRAQLLAAQQNIPVEVTGLRTEDSTTVVNPDGTMTTTVANSPVNVKKADGSWTPVDTKLSVGADGRLHAGAVPFSLSLSNGGNDAAVDVTPGSGKRAKWLSGSLPTPTLDGSTARYVNVKPGVDLLASVTPSGFELSYVLTKRPARGLSLQMPLQLTGLTLGADANGDPQLTGDGKTVVQGAPARMWDASTDPGKVGPEDLTSVPQTVSSSAGAASITLSPSDGFLQDPATQYPVKIDPFYGLTFHYGTYVYQPTAYANTNYDGQNYFRSGLSGAAGTAQRTLLRFQIPTSLTGTHIQDASLRMYLYSAANCASTSRIRTLSAAFDPTTVTWANQPAFSGPYDITGFAANCGNQWQTIHMTDVANLWINGGTPNYGFMVNGDEADTTSAKNWYSENLNGGTYKPTLSITYNSYPGTTGNRYLAPQSLDATSAVWTNTVTPTLRGAATDADGGNNFMKAEIWNSAKTTQLWSGSGASVKAGSTSPVTVPAGVLTDGTAYAWRAKQNDGTDDSLAYSSWGAFTVDTTAPATPGISSSSYPANSWASTMNAGTFTLSSTGSNDVAEYDYRFDGGQWQSAKGNVGATNSATNITLTPPAGWVTLHVVAIDRAGNRSPEATYSFGTQAAISSPASGVMTQRYVHLGAQSGPGNPSVRFQYRLKTTDSWTDLPVGSGGAVTDAGLNPISSWGATTTTTSWGVQSPDLILDVRKLLDPTGTGNSAVDGTVQLQALFNNGSIDYPSGNTATVTLDQHGFGGSYATEQVGPAPSAWAAATTPCPPPTPRSAATAATSPCPGPSTARSPTPLA